jgi:hypothetical protein
MLLKHFLNDFEMGPVAPIITSITLVFTFHKHQTMTQNKTSNQVLRNKSSSQTKKVHMASASNK